VIRRFASFSTGEDLALRFSHLCALGQPDPALRHPKQQGPVFGIVTFVSNSQAISGKTAVLVRGSHSLGPFVFIDILLLGRTTPSCNASQCALTPVKGLGSSMLAKR
jgi:hypothetical protein